MSDNYSHNHSSSGQRVELSISCERSKLEKLYVAKGLFEQDLDFTVDMDVFIDMLVEAFLSYRIYEVHHKVNFFKKLPLKKSDVSMVWC